MVIIDYFDKKLSIFISQNIDFYYAPYPAEGRALPKAMNGRGWVGCICIFFAFWQTIVL